MSKLSILVDKNNVIREVENIPMATDQIVMTYVQDSPANLAYVQGNPLNTEVQYYTSVPNDHESVDYYLYPFTAGDIRVFCQNTPDSSTYKAIFDWYANRLRAFIDSGLPLTMENLLDVLGLNPPLPDDEDLDFNE